MIPSIGIMIGCYILYRLVPSSRTGITRALAAVTALVTVIVLVDLSARAATGKDIAELLAPTAEQSSAASGALETVAPETGAPNGAGATVTRANGGSIRTPLAFGIVLAKDSSMTREWVFVLDRGLPLKVSGAPGVTTVFRRRDYGGDFRYQASVTIQTSQALSAIEVVFLVFDVWGQHVRTLNNHVTADIAAGAEKKLDGEWQVDENDAEKHYASIGYVRRVRLADGRILAAAEAPILEEARKLNAKFSPSDVVPPTTKPTGSPAI
jgi:hypothetical protein